MRKSTLTTVLVSLIAGLVAVLVASASPAAADDFDLVAEIEPMVPGDPVVIDDFLAPPSLAFELRVDCEGGLPPVTLWMKNSGATDVTVEVYDYAGPDGMVLDAGSETVVELDFDAYEMDVAIARVYEKDGPEIFDDSADITCLRPDVSFEFAYDCDIPAAWVELTNEGVLEELAGVTVGDDDPDGAWIEPGQTVSVDLPHAPDQVLDVEIFAAGEFGFVGPWSYACPEAADEVEVPDEEAAEPTPAPADEEPVEPQVDADEPADVIEAPGPAVDDTDVDEIAAPVVIPVSGGGSSTGMGIALVLGLGLVLLVAASGAALFRAR